MPEGRTLEGWTRPLPAYLVEAIAEGILMVEQGKGYQYLVGNVVNPQGTLVSFLE